MGSQINPLDLLPAQETISEGAVQLGTACCGSCMSSLMLVSVQTCGA